MTTQAAEKPTTVRFTRVYRSGSGPGYWPGEVAGFPPVIAEDLIERGIAVAMPPASAQPATPKSPDRPDRDKMVSTPPVKK